MKNNDTPEYEFWKSYKPDYKDEYYVYLTDLKEMGWKAWELDYTITFLEDPKGNLSYWEKTNIDWAGQIIASTSHYIGGHFRLKLFENQKELRQTFDLFKNKKEI
jgi:hypothetical protein